MNTSPAAQNAAFETLMCFYAAEIEYVAQGGTDFSIIARTLHPEVVMYQPPSLPYAGEWRGHDGFAAWLAAFGEQWSSLEIRDPQFYPSGDVVFSRSHAYATARVTGAAVNWPLLQLFRVRSGLIVEVWPFHWDTAAILRAAGEGGQT